MKKILFLFIGITSLLLIAGPIKATSPAAISAGALFLQILISLFPSRWLIIILVPIIIGLIFHRRFIVFWNFPTMFTANLFTAIIALNFLTSFTINDLSPFFIMILLLNSLFLTIISFLSSTIGSRFRRINNLQNIFNKGYGIVKIVVLFIVYLLLSLPPYIAIYRSSYSYDEIIIVGSIITIGISAIIFYWIYRKFKLLPDKSLTFNKRDYLYFLFLLLIFIISFIFSFTINEF